MEKTNLFETEFISTPVAAKMLGVSVATIGNWQKLGVLEVAPNSYKKVFLKSAVEVLIEEINNGSSEKLQKRANKKFTNKKRKHDELNDCGVDLFLKTIDDLVERYSVDEILLAVAGCIFDVERQHIVNLKTVPVWLDFLQEEIDGWLSSSDADSSRIMQIKQTFNEIPVVIDLLGKTYQHISASSHKATKGVFYTPALLANSIVSEFHQPNDRVLDPSCGSGSFLIEVLQNKLNSSEHFPLNQIYGLDIDPIAVHICRINLILIAREECNGTLNVYKQDSILYLLSNTENNFGEEFDFIVTNPPWGADFSLPINTDSQLMSIATDSFATFLSICMDKLSGKGRLSFLLPDSFLDVASHAPIRKKILKHASAIKVKKLGKVFKGLLTNVVKIDLVNKAPSSICEIKLQSDDGETTINQTELLAEKDSSFIFNVSEAEVVLIQKLFNKPHKLIGKESAFALGIVTGNNAKLISNEKLEGYEVILKGKDIGQFTLSESSNFIKFDKKTFQQCADEAYFRCKEKLIYRFIANKFIFAYDNKQRLTLNSANILIPNIGMPIKVVLAILQSNVIQFIFKAKFNTIKILRKHIESMPIFILENDIQLEIERIVDSIIDQEIEGKESSLIRLNGLIYKALRLEPLEIDTIEQSLLK